MTYLHALYARAKCQCAYFSAVRRTEVMNILIGIMMFTFWLARTAPGLPSASATAYQWINCDGMCQQGLRKRSPRHALASTKCAMSSSLRSARAERRDPCCHGAMTNVSLLACATASSDAIFQKRLVSCSHLFSHSLGR